MFYIQLKTATPDLNRPKFQATQCAILMYEEILREWNEVIYEIGLSIYVEMERNNTQAVLNNLKERLK